jgi:hypothetical protein
MTVHQLLQTMSAREFSEWMALSYVEADERRDASLRASAKSKLESRPRKR